MTLKGWRILDRRVRTPRGEVDLVAKRWGTIAFIEVKWRANLADLDTAIDEYRLRRVAAAAEVIASRYMKPGNSVQVDVLLLAPGYWPRHISNAWIP